MNTCFLSNMKIVVVIPAYNEQAQIYKVVKSVKSLGYEVVVIDDGSRDFTGEEAMAAGALVLWHYVNRGYGAALSTGNLWALNNGYDIVVHFDADGQHNPNEIKFLVSQIIADRADVVIGSRFLQTNKTTPLARKALIKLAIFFTWFFSGIKLTDAHNGFRAISNYALRKLECQQDGMSYSSEIIDQIAEHKLCLLEMPVTITYSDYSRAKGESNFKKVMLGIKFIWGRMIR